MFSFHKLRIYKLLKNFFILKVRRKPKCIQDLNPTDICHINGCRMRSIRPTAYCYARMYEKVIF